MLTISSALSVAQAAVETTPAGGAEVVQVAIATGAAVLLTAVLLLLGVGHRTGRFTLLGKLADFSERVSGMPGWVALPGAVIAGALITALVGMMWDISLHIADGRDEGPLANPAHYLILGGLFGVFAAGYFAMVLPKGDPGSTSVKITRNWRAPLGGVLITACGAFSLIGFPLDDVWHRIFGQDVTLWGPTHLMLIGGASMTLVGLAVLMIEGRRAVGRGEVSGGGTEPEWIRWLRTVALTGALLLGLNTFQAEFDFGIPQFRQVFGPMLVMLAATAALVAVRVWSGRGAALGAALFFVAIRGAVAFLVGPVLGEPTPFFHLYLVPALLIELVALVIVSDKQPLRFGLACGAAVGTVGLAAEWAWTHVWMPIPWSLELFPEGAILGFLVALSGAAIGAWAGARLGSDRIARTPDLRWAAVAGAIAITAMTTFALFKPVQESVTATVALSEAGGGAERMVNAEVRFEPASATEGAELISVIGWQGGDLALSELEESSPGVFTTAEPVPVYGTWKTVVRLHRGNTISGMPIYLPEDRVIPAEGVPADARFTRPLVAEHEILQREQKDGVAGWLTGAAYAVVLLLAIGFLALIAWGLHRLSVMAPRRDDGDRGGPVQVAATARPPVPVGSRAGLVAAEAQPPEESLAPSLP